MAWPPPKPVWSGLDMDVLTMDIDFHFEELTHEQAFEEIDNFYGKTPSPEPAVAPAAPAPATSTSPAPLFSSPSKRLRGPNSPDAGEESALALPAAKKQKVETPEQISPALPTLAQDDDDDDDVEMGSPSEPAACGASGQQSQAYQSDSSLTDFSLQQQQQPIPSAATNSMPPAFAMPSAVAMPPAITLSPAFAMPSSRDNATDNSLGSSNDPPAQLQAEQFGLRTRQSRGIQPRGQARTEDRRDSAVTTAVADDDNEEDDEDEEEERDYDMKSNGQTQAQSSKKSTKTQKQKQKQGAIKKRSNKTSNTEVSARAATSTRATRQTTAAAAAAAETTTPKKKSVMSSTIKPASAATPTKTFGQRKSNPYSTGTMTHGNNDTMGLGANYNPRETRAGTEAKKNQEPNPGQAAKRRHQKDK